MKLYTQKLKGNKRVTLSYSENHNVFILQFKRLKEPDEIIETTPAEATFSTQLFRNKLVVTTILLSVPAAISIVLNFKKFFEDYEKGEYPNFNL